MAKSPYVKENSLHQIGDVKESILGETEFQLLHGPSWILMDGRDVTGTGYHALTGQTTVPDGRGVFLRGKNNGRADGNQNPDGDLAIGQTQLDKTRTPRNVAFAAASNGAHVHNLLSRRYSEGSFTVASLMTQTDRVINSISPSYAPSNSSNNAVQSNGAHVHSVSGGDTETNPKNITVNIFVKVD